MKSLSTWLIGAVLLTAGCQKTGELFPVEGELLVAGQPAGGASLAFHPLDGSLLSVVCPVGVTDPEGHFHLTTRQPNDGAPSGEYAVTIVWPDETKMVSPEIDCPDPLDHDRLAGLYANPKTTPVRARVESTENRLVLDANVLPHFVMPETDGQSR